MMVKTFRGNQVKVTVSGNGKMAFNDAQVTLPDVTAGNGAVQAIDAVLSPHKKLSGFKSLKSHNTAPKKGLKNLVQVCKEQGFTSFAQALIDTKMDRVVNHEGLFTIFAPTNEAFDNPTNYHQKSTLEERVQFHIGRGAITKEKMDNQGQMHSLLSKRMIQFDIYKLNGKVMKTFILSMYIFWKISVF